MVGIKWKTWFHFYGKITKKLRYQWGNTYLPSTDNKVKFSGCMVWYCDAHVCNRNSADFIQRLESIPTKILLYGTASIYLSTTASTIEALPGIIGCYTHHYSLSARFWGNFGHQWKLDALQMEAGWWHTPRAQRSSWPLDLSWKPWSHCHKMQRQSFPGLPNTAKAQADGHLRMKQHKTNMDQLDQSFNQQFLI